MLMAVESFGRLFNPVPIVFDQAIIVATIGLAVNVLSAWWLRDNDHTHGHSHPHDHAHRDLNLRAAYLHVIADATTSLLAIVALVLGKFIHWNWADSIMGIVGAVVVAVWAWSLIRDTSRVLLDREMDSDVVEEIRAALESDADTRVCDLHVWRVGRDKFACAVSIVTHGPKSPSQYKALLSVHEEVAHVTIEVNHCVERSLDKGNQVEPF